MTGFLFVILAFVCLAAFYRLKDSKYRWALLALGVVALIAEIGINQSRTGYLIEFSALLAIFWHKAGWRGILTAGMTLAVIISLFYWLSPSFKYRVDLGVTQAVHYVDSSKNVELSGNSVGLRIAYNEISIGVWAKGSLFEKIFGYGVGSVAVVTKPYLADLRSQPIVPLMAKIPGESMGGPENQYLYYLVENGLLGMFYFIFMFCYLYYLIQRLDSFYGDIGRITLIAVGVGCMFNMWLQTFSISHLLIIMLSISYARTHSKGRLDVSYSQEMSPQLK